MGSDPIWRTRVIASRRGLAALLAIAMLLGVLLLRDLRRAPPALEDRALVTGLDPNYITAMTWDRSPLPAVTVSGTGTDWTWTSNTFTAHADARVVRDVLAALRAGRWQRTGKVAAAGKLRAQLSVTIGTNTRVIGIGEALPGTEQTWLVVGDRALLVDSWVARALDPDPLALRERRPVPELSHGVKFIVSTETETARFEGQPRRQLQPRILLVRPELVAELERALESIEIVRLSRPPEDSTPTVSLELPMAVRVSPTCLDDHALAWLASDLGDGCIPRATYDAIIAATHALLGPPQAVADPRPLPAELETIVLADRRVLELDRVPSIDGKPADSEAVIDLLAVLAAPADIVPAPKPMTERGRLLLAIKGGATVTLVLFENNLVRREGEPIALRLSNIAYNRLLRGAPAYADKSVWNEEPTTVTSLVIDGITYTRGAVIGEWTRAPAGAFDPARVEAVVAALSAPRRTADVESMNITHRVTLTVTPPVGAPVVHHVGVASFRCLAIDPAATIQLSGKTCEALDALAR